MIVEKLIFRVTAGNYSITLNQSLRPAITYAVNDLKDPSKRKSDYSKTITLPSSKELDKLFNDIFEVNVQTLSFNPNKKTDITYLAGDEVQLEGYLKLDEVVINDRNKIEYKVSIFGNVGDLFNNIGEKELTDIAGLDKYNHDRSSNIMVNSWATSIEENGAPVAFTLGKGYVYPLIEYGYNTDLQEYGVMSMIPAIYAKEYLDGIFTDAGKTYTSAFFNSSLFKRLIIPFNGLEINKTEAQIDTDLFRADGTTATTSTANTWNALVFPNEVLDPGLVYDNTTGVYTVNDAGYYDFNSICDFKVEYTPSGNSVDVFINRTIGVQLGIIWLMSISPVSNTAALVTLFENLPLPIETVIVPPKKLPALSVNISLLLLNLLAPRIYLNLISTVSPPTKGTKFKLTGRLDAGLVFLLSISVNTFVAELMF